MQFSFGVVERVLAQCQHIRDDRRSAFANRLKNYQKAGFPAGINTGRGRAATYDVGHLLQLGLALELNQLGLNPERAAAVIASDMHSVAMSFSLAAGAGLRSGNAVEPTFLYLDPAALSELMIVDGEDRAVRSFFYAGIGIFKDLLAHWDSSDALARLSIINVSALLWQIAHGLAAEFESLEIADVYEEVCNWSAPHIYSESVNGSDKKA